MEPTWPAAYAGRGRLVDTADPAAAAADRDGRRAWSNRVRHRTVRAPVARGPAWLATVLAALPAAGIRVSTLRGAVEAGHVGPPVQLGRSSWGAGKDWRVWEGPAVQDLTLAAKGVQDRLLSTLDAHRGPVRDPVLDQLAREGCWRSPATGRSWSATRRRPGSPGPAAHAGRYELADRPRRRRPAGATAPADRLRGRRTVRHLDAASLLEQPPPQFWPWCAGLGRAARRLASRRARWSTPRMGRPARRAFRSIQAAAPRQGPPAIPIQRNSMAPPRPP